jgi:hypothetical protein
MAIEALKKIFQIPALKQQKEVSVPGKDQKKRRPPMKEKEGSRGKIDIKV